MYFLTLDYIKKTVIPVIQKNFSRPNNPSYDYLSEHEGMEKLNGCLERAKLDYIPEFIPKAAQLFLCINLGHAFLNGNKRISLVTLLSFILENGYGILAESLDDRKQVKEKYSEIFSDIFPNFENFEDEKDFTAQEFGFYNLTIAVLEYKTAGMSHDDLKKSVEEFLFSVTYSPEQIEHAMDLYHEQLKESE